LTASLRVIDDGVSQILDALPKTIFRAQRSAVGSTTTWAKKQLQTRMAVKTHIPKKAYTAIRVKAKRNKETGVVWIGLDPIKARYAGRVRPDIGGRGAWAGEYYFAGAFAATMPGGLTSVYKRQGRARFPIVEQTVNIKVGFEVADVLAREAQQELRKRFMLKMTELESRIK
jgi:hypothetical protein